MKNEKYYTPRSRREQFTAAKPRFTIPRPVIILKGREKQGRRTNVRIGIHLPLAGGFKGAADRAREIGCRSLQIFSGNPRGWVKKPLDPDEIAEFRAALAAADLLPLVVHATYLINLAAPDEDIYQKSLTAFADDLRRAGELGAAYYVIHPGSPKNSPRPAARARVVEALKYTLDAVPDGPDILLETTAGAGHALGANFEELAELLEPLRSNRLGICFDTCHAFVAGYELRTAAAVREIVDALEKTVGLDRLRCLHINDTRGELGSHLDRHAHLGEGELGTAGLRAFFGEKRLHRRRELPAILETPRQEPNDDARDVRAAVEIAAAVGAVPKSSPAALPDLAALDAAPVPAVKKSGGRKKTARGRKK